MTASRNGTMPFAAAVIRARSTVGSSDAAATIRPVARADNVPARTAASVSGSVSSFPAVSIARLASPELTPTRRSQSSAAFRSFWYVYAAVSSTRFTALPNIPSSKRR